MLIRKLRTGGPDALDLSALMQVEVKDFGQEQNRLVTIDDFLPDAEQYVDLAESLAPFPQEKSSAYPGLRRHFSPEEPAAGYVRAVLLAVWPAIKDAFNIAGFSVVGATFALVTKRPLNLKPGQRLPHWDSTDANHLALLHHLHHVPNTGTNFYRHRRTGFERLSEARRAAYTEAVEQDTAEYGPPKDVFFTDSDERFEKIFEAPARFNRLLAYRGSHFHAGKIPDDFAFDPSPRTGRLTGMVMLMTIPAR